MVISQKITFPHLWRAPKSNNTVWTSWEPSAKKRKEHLFILKLSLYPTHIYVFLTKPLPQRPHLCLHSSQGLSAASWSYCPLGPLGQPWSNMVCFGPWPILVLLDPIRPTLPLFGPHESKLIQFGPLKVCEGHNDWIRKKIWWLPCKNIFKLFLSKINTHPPLPIW